jgi:chorismate dehydratase
MNQYNISTVSYINSIPFVYGLKKYNIETTLDIPALCAEKLISGKVDIGLVPIAVMPELKHHRIITPFCISSNNYARTVLLVSQVPIEQIKNIYLDNESRTSVKLIKILAKEYWHIDFEWHNITQQFNPELVNHTTAALVIGDKAFAAKNQFNYSYDLAWEWKNLTGLPFVFACWLGINQINKAFEDKLTDAFSFGLNHINEAISFAELDHKKEEIAKYLTNNISYDLNEQKFEAIKLFLSKIKKIN